VLHVLPVLQGRLQVDGPFLAGCCGVLLYFSHPVVCDMACGDLAGESKPFVNPRSQQAVVLERFRFNFHTSELRRHNPGLPQITLASVALQSCTVFSVHAEQARVISARYNKPDRLDDWKKIKE
jgi:hypothetical protein